MWLVPWAVGAGLDRRVTGGELLILLGALALFLAHAQLVAWWRVRLARTRDGGGRSTPARLALAFAAAGLAVTLPVLDASRLPWLAAIGVGGGVLTAASLRLVTARLDHALPGQTLGALGLPLTAPAAYVAGGGSDARTMLALWLLTATFFVWAVFYVRLKIEARSRRSSVASPSLQARFAAPTLALDVVFALVALLAVNVGDLGLPVLLAFVPAAVQSAVGAARLRRPAVLKRVGILMAVHAALFGVLVIALAR
jgi:hypothetical protein